jgi:ApaG protein
VSYLDRTEGIEVKVVPEYLKDQSKPEHSQYVFAYHIKITNLSDKPVQLVSRHWIITDGRRQVHEVKGLGVVGQQPKLGPGESHEYSSFCPLPTPTGNMRGTFHLQREDGEVIDARIPLFFLRQ